MDRLNTIINDLIISNEFDLIVPVIKAGLLTLVRDNYLSQFLTTIEQLSSQQINTYHLAFIHFNKQLIDIENYLQTLSQTLENQYHLKLFDINHFMIKLPYNAVRQQLLHTTHIIKSTFYMKFIDIFEYYLAAYASQHARVACAELSKNTISCSFCKLPLSSSCKCMELQEQFEIIILILKRLGLLSRVCQHAALAACRHRITNFVKQICEQYSSHACLPHLEQWFETGVITWLGILEAHCDNDHENNDDDKEQSTFKIDLSSCRTELKHHIYECMMHERGARHMFQIIIDYPESRHGGILDDLKRCVSMVGKRHLIIDNVRNEFNKRLLHPGVGTTDILAAFINAIRVLRYLDSTGVMMELACHNVKQFLARREDTIRVIVSNMNEHGVLELDELTQPDSGTNIRSSQSLLEDEWEPEPIEALTAPERALRPAHSRDLMSMLVSIYGHAELFVEEYVHMLADRMLSGQSNKVDIGHEGRYVDLLKQRFGDGGLQGCDVMLKDYDDSRLMNDLVRKQLAQAQFPLVITAGVPINTLIISSQYWPEVKFSPIELPVELTAIQTAYTTAYETLKPHRTLHWSPNYGQVNIEIEIGGKTLEFSVTPFHAAIIYKFQDKGTEKEMKCIVFVCETRLDFKQLYRVSHFNLTEIALTAFHLDTWTISDLSAALKCSTACIRKRINLWQNCGLLKEEAKDTFRLVEDTSKVASNSSSQAPALLGVDVDEMNVEHQAEHDRKEHEHTIVCNFVFGMLRSMTSLTLERIYSLLCVYAFHGQHERTLIDVRNILDAKVKSNQLLYTNGLYTLPASQSSSGINPTSPVVANENMIVD